MIQTDNLWTENPPVNWTINQMLLVLIFCNEVTTGPPIVVRRSPSKADLFLVSGVTTPALPRRPSPAGASQTPFIFTCARAAPNEMPLDSEA